ncbi:MAG: glycosyltransferase family 39 protein [Armatimonadota bacterium]|jgi:4-amino-4-deoxy-L-arabinose transferase-like glycosyltransferase
MPERVSKPDGSRRRPTRSRLIPWAIACAAFALYAFGLGSDSLDASDEPYYQEAAREMLESGDWFTPRFNYEPRFEKPPLQYWLIAGAFRALGISTAVGRLPCALAAAVLVLVAYRLGERLFGALAAGWGAALLAVGTGHCYQAQDSKPDAALHVCMWLAVLAFVEISRCEGESATTQEPSRTRRRRTAWQAVFWVALGVGTLLKGPIAVFIPALVALAYVALLRRWRALRGLGWIWGVPLLVAIVVPWYAGMWALHGGEFLEVILLRENLERVVGDPPRAQAWSYYIQTFPVVTLPAALLLIPAAWESTALRRRGDQRRHEGLVLCWSTIVVVLVFFSLARRRMPLYVMPAYLPTALLAGFLAARSLSGEMNSRAASYLAVALAAATILVPVVGAWLVVALGASPAGPTITIVAGLTLLGVLVGALASRPVGVGQPPRSPARAMPAVVGALIGAMVGGHVVLNAFVWPFQEARNPLRPIARTVSEAADPESPVIVCSYKRGWRQLVFYLQRPVRPVSRPEDLADALPEGSAMCVVREDHWGRIPEPIRAGLNVIADFELAEKAKFTRQPENLPRLVDPRYQTALLVARWEPPRALRAPTRRASRR